MCPCIPEAPFPNWTFWWRAPGGDPTCKPAPSRILRLHLVSTRPDSVCGSMGPPIVNQTRQCVSVSTALHTVYARLQVYDNNKNKQSVRHVLYDRLHLNQEDARWHAGSFPWIWRILKHVKHNKTDLNKTWSSVSSIQNLSSPKDNLARSVKCFYYHHCDIYVRGSLHQDLYHLVCGHQVKLSLCFQVFSN